jgi:hypothetical protein
MKNKYSILILIVVVAQIIFILKKGEVKSLNQTNPLQANQVNVVKERTQTTSSNPVIADHGGRIWTPNEIKVLREKSDAVGKKLQEQVLDEWRTPIEFYGIVLDESNNVIVDAKVNFDWNDLSPEGTSYAHTQSDANGHFSITGIAGKILAINVSKDGYYPYHPSGDYFEYGDKYTRFIPNANKPVIFLLRKKGKGADLIKINFPPGIGQIWQLHHNGTPVSLDLLKGNQNVNSIGQLKLEFWRDVSDKNAKKYDWKLQMTMPDGGFVGTGEEFPFNAPESGYQPAITMDVLTNSPNWFGDLHTNYYFQLPNGNYGRMEFDFLPYNGVFTLHSYVNPSGSRDLEPLP